MVKLYILGNNELLSLFEFFFNPLFGNTKFCQKKLTPVTNRRYNRHILL